MFKFILRYVLIGILVWFLRSIFETILQFPTESMMDGLIDIKTQGGQKTLYIIRYIVWIFFLDFLIRYSKPIFSFLSPNAKRFSVTKPFRRFQGIIAEFFMFGTYYLGVLLVFFIGATFFMFLIEMNQVSESLKKATLSEEVIGYIWRNFKSDPIDFIKPAYEKLNIIIFLVALVLYGLSLSDGRVSSGRDYESFLRVIQQSRFGLGGFARFAGLFEEWATSLKDQKQGLFLGRSLYNPYLTIGSEDPRHMITIAGSRAGKGTTAIIPNLLLWKHSVVVIDPKGTNAAVSARRRRELRQDVYLIDPFNIVEGEDTASFDPLANLDPNSPTIREEISVIAEALVVPDPEPKEKHWDDGAKTVIAGLIAHIISSDKIKEKSLFKIRELLSLPPDDQNDLWIDMMMNESAGRLAIDAASRMLRGKGTAEISSILSNADKHTEWLSSPAIQKVLSSSTFEFSQLKEKRTTIYLVLPPNLLETHNRFLRLFINLTLSQMSIGGRSKIPVLMLMDEFLALGRMTEVEKAFGLLAGYNLIMWPFIQDYGRLKDIYKNSVNAFINNSRAIQVFGVFDGETTRFVSERLGNRVMDSYSTKIKNHRTVPLRSPSEVSMDVSAESNRQYIIRAGKTPLLIEKVAYYDNSYSKFKNLYDKDPDYKN